VARSSHQGDQAWRAKIHTPLEDVWTDLRLNTNDEASCTIPRRILMGFACHARRLILRRSPLRTSAKRFSSPRG